MPQFPVITSLAEKINITGSEIIQVSATEYAKLQSIFNKLTGNSVLLDFEDSEEISLLTKPSTADNIITALEKILARIGSDKVALYPIIANNKIGIVGYFTTDSAYISFDITSLNGELTISYRSSDDPITDGTPLGIYNYIHQDATTIHLNTPDKLSSSTSDYIVPGDVRYLDSNTTLVLGTEWDSDSKASNYQAVVVSTGNITKSNISGANGKNFNIMYMDGFDDNPGTTYQAVTFQKFLQNGNNIYILANKCGYE